VRAHSACGSHVLADLYGIEAPLLRDALTLETVLRQAAAQAGARVLSSHFHSFEASGGVTGVVLLAESHMSIHTWPETGFAAADIFMCGAADAQLALAALLKRLAPARHCVTLKDRGESAAVCALPLPAVSSV
jgi:S-adenosylmethionine decarboxylase